MKILFVSNLYPPNKIGGYEELCWEVASRFASLGHDVSVLTSAYGGKVSEWPGQEVHQALRLLVGKTVYDGFDGTPFRREAIVSHNLSAMTEALRRIRPDVVFCWNLYGLDKLFFEFLGKLDTPVVVMLTDNWLASMLSPNYVGDFFARAVYGTKREVDFLRESDELRTLPSNVSAIFGAEYMKTFYAASGIRFSRCEIIHNGVKLPEVAGTEIPRPPLGAAGRVDLLFAGRVVEIKGTHTAIAALAELRARRPQIDWRLDIVGDAIDRKYVARLNELAAERGCADALHFVGRVGPEDLPAVFAAHDLFVFPSLYEPFSLTLIHALASGIPTVATAIGGNPEIVRDGETGVLFPKGDAKGMASVILRLLDHPGLAADLGQAGARMARDFSMERMIAGMESHLLSRCR